MFKGAFILIAVVLMSTGFNVWADAPQAGSAAVVTVPQTNNLASDTGLVSLDFQDADIRNVLKVLAFKSGVNIVAAPDVTGVVNIQLKNVPWQKALDVILSTYGYGFDRKGNIITVMTVENLKKYREDSAALQAQEPLVSKTFSLNYAKAEDVLKIINKLVSRRGFINFDTRTNSIIVRDLESNLELIAQVIKSIDTITPQVSIETRIVETDLSNNDNLGVDWVNGLTGTLTGGAVPTYAPFTHDIATQNFIPGSWPSPSGSLATTPTAGSFTYGTISASQLNVTLQWLSSRTNTKILSNPRIVTLDNQKATINIGLEYPVPNYSFNSSTGQEQVTGFTPLPIGVNFEVTPHVNNAGLITLDLHPQITTLQATITVQNNPFPETSNEEAKTNVMIEDGKTLVIGGMITDQVVTTTTKLPVLGDIPLLGWFFKNTNPVKTRKEVIIFLTPHIIT
ncbi:MAG: type IV pilus secretin PilQ, partial [Candidatus Omnitrophica bacterium]|nr:type IV pilus secretin PilQ [Candidatus Omnitrophota bacterium]